ncbi:MAG: methyltransferase domain-containing protein [Candidatus Xenobiia bacterium LiM19]
MPMWYEELFRNYSRSYEKECFTQGTVGEVDFLEKELGGNKNAKILDIGCGTGRHSIELAKRGYRNITAFDLSKDQITRARENADREKVSINFTIRDARDFNFKGRIDLAIMLCEGSFPLMETDEMNYAILKNAFRSLKRPGKLIFTTLNGLFPLFHSVQEFMEKHDQKYSKNTFDLMTFREHTRMKVTDDSGNEKTIESNERYYVPSEITWQLKCIGFGRTDIFGAKLGAFSREDGLTTEDYEMLVIAGKL